MSISSDGLGRVVRTIWATQLGLELEDAGLQEVEAIFAERDEVAVAVQFSGDFAGVLVQRCSRRVSLLAAASAFAQTGNNLEASDLQDALSELAHMTAGNLKSLLPNTCKVSLPAKVDHDHHTGEVMASAGFTLEGEPLVVTLERG
jgi:CheY-specific phosphatase CheX